VLGWLDRFWHSVTGTVGQAVSDAAHWALHALASVVFGVFRTVGSAWSKFTDSLADFHNAIDAFGKAVWNFGAYVLHHVIPSLLKWAEKELSKLASALAKLYNYVVRELDAVYKWIKHEVDTVTSWVVRDIWDPLKKYADTIYRDLIKWGYYAYKWLTNLPALAEAMIFHIVTSLERNAWKIAKGLGQFALALVMSNLKTFILLIEDIITAVL
jgi:hypothetical protein